MKRIWFVLLMVCTMLTFTACSDNYEYTIHVHPISNFSVPKKAEIGTEVFVTGIGFADTAKLYLYAIDVEMEVKDVKFSASGATFTIPMELREGKYTLTVIQGKEWQLGYIELTAPSLPVSGLQLPSEGRIGGEITIVGSGFSETSQLYLENADSLRMELPITDRTNGLLCTVPDSVDAGVYKLILVQNNWEWVLKEEFNVVDDKKK